MSKVSGGCICGAIRYECDPSAAFMFECHCRDCQHISGGAYAPVVYLSKSAFAFTRGEPQHYSTESLKGGKNKRGFCVECGSRLTGAETAEALGIVAGSLDDPSIFKPVLAMHVADAQSWDRLDPAMPKFDRYPPR
jgi:hypothetical protein